MADESDLPLATTKARSRRVLDVGGRGFARVARVIQEPPTDRDVADEFKITPEERVAGLTPEQRLAGLAPEEVANALTPEMALLALPDVALRALSEDYLASLSADVQAKVRARRGD